MDFHLMVLGGRGVSRNSLNKETVGRPIVRFIYDR